MRAVIQRVSRAEVRVAGQVVARINAGFCVVLGAGPDDTAESARHLAQRIASLRVFGDANGRMNLDPLAADAQILVVSQFTLYADSSRGHRPSFVRAASPELAAGLYAVF